MKNLGKANKINMGCYILFGLFFIIFLTIYGYGVYFLSKMGVSYIEIGFTIGISALIASILQLILGRLIDKYSYSWQNVVLILNILIIVCCILMFFIPVGWCTLLFGLIIIFAGCMYPFINSSPFYYENNGIETNYGISRGFGSLTFTVFSLIIGFCLVRANTMILLLFTIASSFLIIITIFLLPDYGMETKSKSKFEGNILRKYPIFTLMLIALVLFMIFQNMFECYMINILENIGGNVADVGVSNSISAILELPIMFFFIKILDKASAKKLMIVASVFYIFRAVLIFFAANPMDIYISQILQMFSFAIIIPASVHLTNDMLGEENQYEGQAFLGATVTVGLIFANFIGGNVLQNYGVGLLCGLLILLTVFGFIFAVSTLFFNEN